jgi:hypothetical protein
LRFLLFLRFLLLHSVVLGIPSDTQRWLHMGMEFSSAFERGAEQLASDELVTFLNVQNSVAQWHSLITVHHLSNP